MITFGGQGVALDFFFLVGNRAKLRLSVSSKLTAFLNSKIQTKNCPLPYLAL